MLRKFFAKFLALIFVSSAVSFSFLFAFYSTAFDKNFYEEEVSTVIQSFFVEEIPKKVEYEKLGLNETEFKSVLLKTFTREDVFFVLVDLYEDFSAKVSEPTINLSLKWLQNEKVELANNLAAKIFKKLEKCDSLIDFNFDETLRCLPPEIDERDLAAKLQTELDIKFFSKVPSSVDIDIGLPPNVSNSSDILFFEVMQRALFLTGGILLFILALVFILVGRPFHLAFRWVATTVLTAAILSGLLLLFFRFLFVDLINNFLNSLTVTAFEYRPYLINLLELFIQNITLNVLTYLIPLIIFSLLILFLAIRQGREAKLNNNTATHEPQ